MKYTDKKNNITFGNVSKAGSHLASGPLGLNGKYRDNGGTIDNINEDLIIYNAIDINWNGAQVGDGVTLNTTGDLLSWIKTISNKTLSGTTISISDDGFWVINGVKTNMKVTGKDGLTPRIGPAPNYNWFIGDIDTGISAKGNIIKDDLQNLVRYFPTIGKNDLNAYKIGTIKINEKSTDIYALKSNVEASYITNLISNNVSYSSNVAESDVDSYSIGTLKISGLDYIIRGRKYYSDGKGSGGSGGSGISDISFESKINGESTNTYPIADLTINGEKYSFFGKYFNSGGEGTGGTTFVENTFDPTSILKSISELNSYIDDLKNRLSEIHNENQESINNDLKRILEEWKKFKDANGIVDGTGWHWATDENSGIRTYLSQYGLFDGNGTGTWSTLELRVDKLEGRVNAIKQTVDDNGNVTLDISESMVKQYVRETLTGEFIAGALMESKYILAKSDDYSSNSDINVLKWLLSQFKSESGRYGTLAQMLCDSSQGPMSEVLTRINTIDERVSSVETSMSALFEENVSGVHIKSDLESAIAEMFTSNGKATSAIINQIKNDETTVNVIAAAAKGKIEAGLHAVMYETYSNGNLKYKHSDGTITATKGNDGVPIISGPSASVVAAINNGESFVTIDADKINITGIINNLLANTAFINNLVSSDAFINNLEAKNLKLTGSIFKTGNRDTYLGRLYTLPNGKAVTLEIYNENHTQQKQVEISANQSNGGWINLWDCNYSVSSDNVDDSHGNNLTIHSSFLQFTDYGNPGDRVKQLCLYNNVTGLSPSLTIWYNGGITTFKSDGAHLSSDIRLKNNLGDYNISIEDIANAPLFKFTWKNSSDNNIYIGSSALYWNNIVPEAINISENGTLLMNYELINTINSITSAREIIKLKEENKSLRQRIETLESKI